MHLKKQIENWIDQLFRDPEYRDCFLVDIEWNSTQRKLVIYIDCDKGLTLQRCQSISKYITPKLEESIIVSDNYRLDVSSPGLDKPLKQLRQYQKNLGRQVRIQTVKGDEIIGKLIAVEKENITIETTEKEEKKKKKKLKKLIQISVIDINKTFVEISFKK